MTVKAKFSPIYVVQGSRGECSDRAEWIVCAFTNKEDADDHAGECQRTTRAAGRGYWEDVSLAEMDILKEQMLDKSIEPDRYGVDMADYEVVEVELRCAS